MPEVTWTATSGCSEDSQGRVCIVSNGLTRDLAQLRGKILERSLSVLREAGGKLKIDGRTFLNFSSNDYLGLARHPEVISASRRCLEAYGCGATASRLVTGTLQPHYELEQAIAALKGYPEDMASAADSLPMPGP